MMKKKVCALLLACVMATAAAGMITPITEVKAEDPTDEELANMSDEDIVNLIFEMAHKTRGEKLSEDGALIKEMVDEVFGEASGSLNAQELKPTGVAGVRVDVISGADKDLIIDNGVKPALKEMVKNFLKYFDEYVANGAPIVTATPYSRLSGIYYGNLILPEAGDVTFKIEDDKLNEVKSGDSYALVLHYTGNAADEDGITAQYVKISSSGKITAHFNSDGPIAILPTIDERAQFLANAFSRNSSSDAAGAVTAAPAAASTTTTAPAATTATTTATAAATSSTTTASGIQTTTPVTVTTTSAPVMVVR